MTDTIVDHNSNFVVERKWGLFVRIRNLGCVAGVIRLLSYKGPTLLTFYQEDCHNDRAVRTVLNCYLFALVHIGDGVSHLPKGLHLNWARLKLHRSRRRLSVDFIAADTYDVHPKRTVQKKVRFHVWS